MTGFSRHFAAQRFTSGVSVRTRWTASHPTYIVHSIRIDLTARGVVKLYGDQHESTIRAAYNYACSLSRQDRFREARALLRKTIPFARRVIGENHDLTLKMRANYAAALYSDPDATLDEIREAVTALEDTTRIFRRIFGSAHPYVVDGEVALRKVRARLRARETPSGNA